MKNLAKHLVEVSFWNFFDVLLQVCKETVEEVLVSSLEVRIERSPRHQS